MRSPQAWSSNAMGARDLGGVYWPLLYIFGLLAHLNISPALIDRIMYLWPIALLTPICMYYFSFYILKSRIGAFTSAIVYSFNIPFIVWSTGIVTAHMAMTLTPLLLLTYFIALEKESFLYAVLSSILIFVIGFYDFRFLYLVVWILFFYTILHFLVFKVKENRISKNILLMFAPLIILPILLNLYWLPSLFQPNFGEGMLNRDLFGTSFVDLTKSIFLFEYLWNGSEMVAFVVHPIPILSLPIPFLAILGVYYTKGRNKYVLYFTLISLLGIFLTKMDHEPFSQVYSWLYLNFPGFNAFRDSTKFYFYIALGYAVLIGAFAKYLAIMPALPFWKKASRIGLIIFINAIFLWNAKPLITGEIRTIYVPREVPSDYLILKDFLKQQDGFYRTLYVPRESRWGYYTNHNPRISSIDMYYGGWKPFVISNEQISRAILSVFQQNFSSNLLNISSVKYVIVPTRDAISDDDFFIYYGNSRSQYIQALNRLSYLKQVNIGTRELLVYENINYRPHIYATPEIESIHKSPIYSKVDYECIQSTQCKILLSNVRSSLFLNFSDNYDSGWKMLAGSVNWNSLSSAKSELPDSFHMRNDASLNSFFLNVDYFKEHFPHDYHVNSDGSINLELTLYFKAQNAIKVGTLITVITLLGLLIYIFTQVFIKIKSRKNS
uniref:hypothetical protein n=1 Tax=Flavobacterium sp. TaxID=239 RepID=UPI00404782A9